MSVNKSNEKSIHEKYENEKWDLKRSILIKKYSVDIGNLDDMKDSTKKQNLLQTLKECLNKTQSNNKDFTSFEQKPKNYFC